jgi:hypothetical protein
MRSAWAHMLPSSWTNTVAKVAAVVETTRYGMHASLDTIALRM